MAEKHTERLVLGALINKPQLLSQVDRYILSVDDFDERLFQFMFHAIANLADEGATKITPQDVELFLKNSATGSALFEKQQGTDVILEAGELASPDSFGTYYNILKKENLLRDLRKSGFDTKDFYDINPVTREAIKINDEFLDLSLQDMVQRVKDKLMKIEHDFLVNTEISSQCAFDGVEELLQELEFAPDIGFPLQGEIFNTIIGGARFGKFVLRSGSSGLGKTRAIVGEACYLAFPIRYNTHQRLWEQVGNSKKVSLIITEQAPSEVQTMVMAYLTGLNESKFKKGTLTMEERSLVRQALKVWERYKDNLHITRIPDPDIQTVKTVIRERAITDGIEYFFYDYIFISPALLNEFRDLRLRNDEVLLLLSTALKDLSVELNVFLMSATQVNAKSDENKEIRNESSIAGSRAIINKADIGSIMARPTKEEYQQMVQITNELGYQPPNIVTDIFKARDSQYTQVRIWSYFDLGCLRMTDLLITNSRFEPIKEFEFDKVLIDRELCDKTLPVLAELNRKDYL